MSDKDFIFKLNEILLNYGYIIFIGDNIDSYLKKYHIDSNSFYNEYRYFHQANHDKVFLYDITNNIIRLIFKSVHEMISGKYSIFYYINITNKFFPVDFANFIMSIEGNIKEEILLKLQMIGY